MTLRKIIYTRADGGLSVVHPVRNTHPEPETMTDAQIEQRAWDRLPPDAINPRYVNAAEVPTDRYFREAWTHSDAGSIVVDMPKAVAIQQDKLRELRAPLLDALDIQFMKALEVSDKAAQAAIVEQKQQLRDVTADQSLTDAKTPDELKQAGLDVLAAVTVDVGQVDIQA